MTSPYENMYLGSFIFALGYAARAKNADLKNTFAHLLQQTPKDKEWADLLTSWAGRQFLFEFKRTEAGVKTERAKRYCKKDCPAECGEHFNKFFTEIEKIENSGYAATAKKSHFVAYGHIDSSNSDLRFMQYSKIIEESKQEAEYFSLLPFCEKMQNSQELGATAEEMANYLSFLSACFPGESGGASGVVISVGDDGTITAVKISEIESMARDLHTEDLPVTQQDSGSTLKVKP